MQVLLYSTDREGVNSDALLPFCGKSKAEVIASFGEPDFTESFRKIQHDLNWDQVDADYWYVFVIE